DRLRPHERGDAPHVDPLRDLLLLPALPRRPPALHQGPAPHRHDRLPQGDHARGKHAGLPCDAAGDPRGVGPGLVRTEPAVVPLDIGPVTHSLQTFTTILPVCCPDSRSWCTSPMPSSGNTRSTTGRKCPASMRASTVRSSSRVPMVEPRIDWLLRYTEPRW